MTPNFDLWSVFRLLSFIQPFTPRHFDVDFKIFNAEIFEINVFERNHLAKLRFKIIGGVQWVSTITATTDGRPAVFE